MSRHFWDEKQVSREPLDGKKLCPYYIDDDTGIVYHHGPHSNQPAEVLSTSPVDALLTCIRAVGFNIYKKGFNEISKEKYEKCRYHGIAKHKHYARVTTYRPAKSVHYYEFEMDHWTDFEKQYNIRMYTYNKDIGELIGKECLGESPMEATLKAIEKYCSEHKKNFNGKLVALSKNEVEQFDTMRYNGIPKGLIIIKADLINGLNGKSSTSYYKVVQ